MGWGIRPPLGSWNCITTYTNLWLHILLLQEQIIFSLHSGGTVNILTVNAGKVTHYCLFYILNVLKKFQTKLLVVPR